MKKLLMITGIVLSLSFLTSCDVYVTTNIPGPDGYPGRAFFGIDYDYRPPYSYWDNNPAVPVDPFFGEYYRTNPGIFDFEYFVNEYDYWYGTYDIWVNPGGPGRPYGERGRDGADSYLLLICNPDGPYEWRKSKDDNISFKELEDGWIEIEKHFDGGGIKVKMKKTNINERPQTQQPKGVFGK
ncbi:hypothetical protein [Luteibaculum oceani]|uniref:Lipoprotein n=1 Tax=Luteibaculum oceani TaxID=1294296 RepID=A0A5C6UUM2_9FLAO|nr:hypothetical protein [Luteibaculum oceani]TXC77073.1 hypothetical protein FRX97_09425 [Luteibaculum oceani]